jgi:hypothetical protein
MFDLIQYLPNDILVIIWQKLNPYNKIFVNKENYITYNSLIDKHIGRYESYIRDIIRNDYSYAFNFILKRQFNSFIQIKNYRYYNTNYSNYIFFIISYCQINNSHKCLNLVNLQLDLTELKKKGCKKNRIKNNRWIH